MVRNQHQATLDFIRLHLLVYLTSLLRHQVVHLRLFTILSLLVVDEVDTAEVMETQGVVAVLVAIAQAVLISQVQEETLLLLVVVWQASQVAVIFIINQSHRGEVTVVYSVLPQLEAVLVGREIFSLVQTQTTQLELVNQVVLVEEVQGEIALLVILTQTLEVERVVKETLAV